MGSTLYFAYGANISRDHMAKACPGSQFQGCAALSDMELIINEWGWATVVHSPGEVVHGALWTLTADCEAVLDTQENVGEGFYTKQCMVVVDANGQNQEVMVYVAACSEPGVPNPGYLESIVSWAESWGFPKHYREKLICMQTYLKGE